MLEEVRTGEGRLQDLSPQELCEQDRSQTEDGSEHGGQGGRSQGPHFPPCFAITHVSAEKRASRVAEDCSSIVLAPRKAAPQSIG